MSLTAVVAMSAVMWIPYDINMVLARGLRGAVGYSENPAPMAGWAQRMKAAHYNSVENLVVFAALVLIAHAAGISTDITVLASQLYFWARLVHLLAYTFAIPWVRSLGFIGGWVCQIMLLSQLI